MDNTNPHKVIVMKNSARFILIMECDQFGHRDVNKACREAAKLGGKNVGYMSFIFADGSTARLNERECWIAWHYKLVVLYYTHTHWAMTMTDKTTKQILIDARNSIAANNYANLSTGGLVSYKEEGSQELCFCALGHIALAAGMTVNTTGLAWPFFEAHVSAYEVLNRLEAVQVLADEINPSHSEEPTGIVFELNDRNAKSYPEAITQAFDRAIANLD